MTRWETPEVRTRISVAGYLAAFPKFILGLFAASLLATLASRSLSLCGLRDHRAPGFITPLTNLRVWVFTFSFLSIGLTTRLRGFAPASGNAFIAFATGVMVNLVLGFVLSAMVFQSYWANLGR